MFPNFLRFKFLSRSATRESGLVYTSLLLTMTLRFTRGKRKICSTIKKSRSIMNMIVALDR